MRKRLKMITFTLSIIILTALTGCGNKNDDSIKLSENLEGQIVEVLYNTGEDCFSYNSSARLLLNVKNSGKKIENLNEEDFIMANESGEIQGKVKIVCNPDIHPNEESYVVLELENDDDDQNSFGFMINDSIYTVDVKDERVKNHELVMEKSNVDNNMYTFENEDYKILILLNSGIWDDGSSYLKSFKYELINKTNQNVLVPNVMAHLTYYMLPSKYTDFSNYTLDELLNLDPSETLDNITKEDYVANTLYEKVIDEGYLRPEEVVEGEEEINYKPLQELNSVYLTLD